MAIHAWDVTPKEAIQIQEELRNQVRVEPLGLEVRRIAGCDVSMNIHSKTVYAGFVVLSYPELEPLEHAVVVDEAHFPYLPGLLSFREIPALLKAWEKLVTKPDLIVVDGQGIAHPRRLGLASHLGVVLDVPTIGCAKSVLVGTHEEPGQVGEAVPLTDLITQEIIGEVLLSKERSNPIIISPGHRITQEESLAIVLSCLRGYRLPEPTRLAHHIVNEYRLETSQEYDS